MASTARRAGLELLAADPRVTVDVLPAMSFLDLAWDRLGVDPVAVGDYLGWLAVPAPRTIYRNIFSLRAGERATFRAGRLEVRTAWRQVNSSWNQIGASRQARFAAADALAAVEMRREQGEALTPTFVQLILDRQEALAQAERQEASAISNYNIAISRLELSKGTLLRYNNVIIEEEQTPFVKTFGMYGR